MKKRIFMILLSMILVISSMCGILVLPSSATGSHGLYMDVDTSPSNYKSKAYMLDFYSDSGEATYTYWSNTGFAMEYLTTAKAKGYKNMSGGGGYAGLQIRGSVTDRVGIMSIWEYRYRDKSGEVILNAERIYPEGKSTFGGEGEGVNCIYAYPWKSGQWYRELLFSWQDEETGNTFAGTWFYDYEADKWTLFSYFDTKLISSYFKGDHFGQFLENYVDRSNKIFRSFRYRNTYVQSYETEEWLSAPHVTLSSDDNRDAVGIFEFGVSEDSSYAYGWVDGSQPNPNFSKKVADYTLSQPEKPTFGTPDVGEFTVKDNVMSEKTTLTIVKWAATDNSTPQLSYNIVFTDNAGNEIASKYSTRPEVTLAEFKNLGTDAYRCTLTVTDVFGQQTVKTFESENFGKEPVEPTEEPTETLTPVTTETPVETETAVESETAVKTETPDVSAESETALPETTDEEKSNTTTYVIIGVAAAVVVCGAVAGLLVFKKKKK